MVRIKICRLTRNPHGGDQCKPGSYRSFRVVFTRPRVTEIDERTVAHISGDETFEPPNYLSNALLIGSDHLAQIFGIELR